jgi:hypothetical protein
MNNAVSFSHNWNHKIGEQENQTYKARLVSVVKISPMELIKKPEGLALLRLDTGYENPMKIEQTFSNFRSWEIALLLTFYDSANDRIFTTIRSYNPDKAVYYNNKIGQEMEIILEGNGER